MILAALVAIVAAVSAQNVTEDIATLNYLLALEHLEYAYCREGLEKLGEANSTNPLFIAISQVCDQEKQYLDNYTQLIIDLGGTPYEACKFNFSGWNDTEGFLAAARIGANVATSVYAGVLYWFQDNKLLTKAASIATVKGRHAAFVNQADNIHPFPHAHDSPLDKQSVFSLATIYITSCAQWVDVQPHPHLSASPFLVTPGTTVNITTNSTTWEGGGNGTYCVFYTGSTSKYSLLEWDEATNSSYRCPVPETPYTGDTYLFLSKNPTYDLWNPEPIVAGPALIFFSEDDT